MVYGVKPHICLYIVIALSEFPATSRSGALRKGAPPGLPRAQGSKSSRCTQGAQVCHSCTSLIRIDGSTAICSLPPAVSKVLSRDPIRHWHFEVLLPFCRRCLALISQGSSL